jgi:hypothetical protein
MQNDFVPIYNFIDQPKKYAGLTIFEVLCTGFVGAITILNDQVILGTLGCCLILPASRYVEEKIRSHFLTRFAFFHLSDLIAHRRKQLSVFGKYYL